MIGPVDLDVQMLSDGTVRVVNGPAQAGTYKWHVQRVKIVAVKANGDVK